MCGRYTYKFTWRQIHEQLSGFHLALDEATLAMHGPAARYNVAPTTAVPVLRASDDDPRTIAGAMLRWWLVPHWSKEETSKYPMFNARAETAATKPAFRGPMKYRRCVLPVSSFYEWKAPGKAELESNPKAPKRPYSIARADGAPLYLAGLWDCWRDELESCTILTTTPNAEMATLHHRMPCVLEPESIAAWLDPTQHDAAAVAPLLAPAPDGLLELTRVSRRVGNARVDDPSLVEPCED